MICIMYVTRAVCNTIVSMGPQYAKNVYDWVKSAVYDAPYRFYLDVQLEHMELTRKNSLSEKTEEQK